MAFSGTMYSEISSGAYQVDDLLKDFNNRINAATDEISSIVSALTVFGTEWGPIVAAADALAAADTTNQAKQNLASHVANLVADYGTILARAQALDSAINPA